MSATRAYRLARTFALAGFIALLCDRDTIMNGLDLLTYLFAIASVTMLLKARGLDNA